MIKIGMMIGDRYEIIEKIGAGGMSDVYKAKCHKLNRFVAVKVLKQEFSENANFVSKFRIEAQAAAGLMHPNIVNVYDVGEENGIYYIVMELVEGITLKRYIEKKARLTYKEAVSIAIQVCMGIEAAHNNHIIHRDIKPQNIIISKDGKVKVTDFGIAKAATSNTITSNVMGSVHYTSPEQARGGYSDEKSDIYSLGITLFEMLTGRVPFNGETTVAIAIKHIQEELTSPKEFVEELPSGVEAIVMKCCQKSPDRRYQNMPELIADLKQSLVNPEQMVVVNRDVESEGMTRAVSSDEIDKIKRETGYTETMNMRLSPEYERMHTGVIYDENGDIQEEVYDDGNPKMERISMIMAISGGIGICIIIIVLLSKIMGIFQEDKNPNADSRPPIIVEDSSESVEEPQIKTVEMISVIGWNVEDAKKALVKIGLIPEETYVESPDYEEGDVINTSIPEGREVEINTKVKLTVSSGVAGALVPSVTGLTYEEAYSRITASDFLVNRSEGYSATVEKGKIISQTPSADEVAPVGSVVTVTVSLGAETVKNSMPYLIGMDEMDATIRVVELGFRVNAVTYVYNNDIAPGLVCLQNYSAGTLLEPGTGIDIMISKGKESVTYKCNAVMEAPGNNEAPGYVSGSEVRITLVTDEGKILLDTTTTSFPYTANFYGITSPSGTITMYYSVTTPGTTKEDPETGETITTPGTTETRSFTRRIAFVQE